MMLFSWRPAIGTKTSTESAKPMIQQQRKTNHDSCGLMPGSWFECRTCRGDEGELVNGQWVNCRTCEGQGGWPEDVYVDTTAVDRGRK